MIEALSRYFAIAMLAVTMLVGGYAYHQHQLNTQLEVEVVTYKTAAAANLKAKEDSDASCLVTVDSLNGYYKKKAELEAGTKAIQTTIDTLPTLTIKEKANEAPASIQTPSTRYSDDDRLSPELMRLLDSAYCNGGKDDCSTPSK